MRPREWKPWSNTLAYFPFETDQTDHSSNWASLSATWTKQNIWYSFYTWSWGRVTISMNNIWNVKWFCAWQKLDSASWTTWLNTFYDKTSMWWNLYDSWIWPTIWTFYTSSYSKASQPLSDVNNWHLYWIWYDWTNMVYWIDWQYWILYNWVWYNFGNTFALQACNNNTTWTAIHSKFIAESECWDASLFSKYFNSTKELYWIS